MSSSSTSSTQSSPRVSRSFPDAFQSSTAPPPMSDNFEVPPEDKDTFKGFMTVEDDLLTELMRHDERDEVKSDLWIKKGLVEVEVAYHTRSGIEDSCRVPTDENITTGRFNVNVNIDIAKRGSKGDTLRMRVPDPSAHNEKNRPGSIEEKMRIDIGSYIWWVKNMAIRTGKLIGFGMPNGGFRFTHIDYLTDFERAVAKLAQSQLPEPDFPDFIRSDFINCGTKNTLPYGYLLYEMVNEGTPLVESMAVEEDDITQDSKIIRSTARLCAELTKTPYNRIGTFVFRDDGFVTLSNRPLFSSLTLMETNGAERVIQSGVPFTNTTDFFSSMLDQHDSRFVWQRNAVDSEFDCHRKMVLGSFMRDIAPNYLCPQFNTGPYFVQMLDLDISHIRVDADWNIVAVVDLEWLSVLPVETMQEVAWLTGMLVDKDMDGEFLTHSQTRKLWLDTFEEEETALLDSSAVAPARSNIKLASYMRFMEQSLGFWFGAALMSHNGMYDSVQENLAQRLSHAWSESVRETLDTNWSDTSIVADRKLEDAREYMRCMKEFCRRLRESTTSNNEEGPVVEMG